MIEQPRVLDTPIIALTWFDLVLAGGLVLIAVGIARSQRLGVGRGFVVGAIRTVVQLTCVGYILVYIFALDRWPLVVAALLLMLAVAVHTALAWQRHPSRQLYGAMGVALLAGSGLTLVYVGAIIVQVDPWYNPRYLIPLFGMIVGNAMNAAALATERLAGEMESRRAEIEAYLALGASAERAAQEPVRRALVAALIPTINSLMVVGIVSLPGMMTGQILAGVSPLTAIRYQIVVMFMLCSAVAISAAAVTLWYRWSFFTPALQLRDPVVDA
ncbi:MAG: ABC transporter permease [Longimicrobiales bacterium]